MIKYHKKGELVMVFKRILTAMIFFSVTSLMAFSSGTCSISMDTCTIDSDCLLPGETCNVGGGAGNTPPTVSNVTITGILEVNETISVNYTYDSSNTYEENGTSFRWYRADDSNGNNQVLIPTGGGFGTTSREYTLKDADAGKFIQVEVIPNDGYSMGVISASSWMGPVTPIPENTPDTPSVTNTTTDGANQILWTRQWGDDNNVTATEQTADSAAIDGDGYIYITGKTGYSSYVSFGPFLGTATFHYFDAFIAKYDSDGTQKWLKNLNTSGTDYGLGVTTDLEGKIYLIGRSMMNLHLTETNTAFYAKYDSNGTQEWIKQINTNLYTDINQTYVSTTGRGIATDTDGNIYIVGEVWNVYDRKNKSFIVKYDSNGNKISEANLTVENASVSATSVVTNADGSIYLIGHTDGSLDGKEKTGNNYDMFIAKYDSSLNQIWIQQQPTTHNTISTGITTDVDGNVYATGYLEKKDSNGHADIFVVKYDSDGKVLWFKFYGTAQQDIAKGITDQNGYVYVTGYTNGSLGGQSKGGQDAFVLKFDDTNGTLTGSMNLGTGAPDAGNGIAVDSGDYVYIAGHTSGIMENGVKNNRTIDAFLSKLLVVEVDETSEGKDGGALGYLLPLFALLVLYRRKKQSGEKTA